MLVVHEWLYVWAGAERCLEELLKVLPHADVLAGVITPEIRAKQPIAARARETWLGNLPGARRHHRWFLPLHSLAFASVDTSDYDVVISLSHSFGKLVGRRKGAVHLCYCFSPPRYLWDLRETYDRHLPTLERTALLVAGAPLRALDRIGAAHVDKFVSISKTVAGRVQRAYNRRSDVVYPPAAAKGMVVDVPRRPFLLSLGRLVPYKRVDLAIRAAERLQMKLVVAGDGPDRARLESMAGPNVEFVGQVTEETAGQLLSTCTAFVFCGEEDFGIAPVEANAHGTPVVAFSHGGAGETMVDGETAVLFHGQEPGAVASAIETCLAKRWNAARLRANAERFSPVRFRHEMTAQIAAALEAGARRGA